jgi:para-aminobenzoate synthetase/4-amino-4-deoxychorismate lyase
VETVRSAAGAALPGPWQPSVDVQAYCQSIDHVRALIARGETYQVNYTYRLRCEAPGPLPPAWPVFATLASSHAAPYAAFIETEDWAVCSISPELFFTLDGDLLASRPMKGTAKRGTTLEDDRARADWLYHSEKNRAENLMIVDMVRNDMGSVARTGSVRVPELFKVEKYPTVWQMTSTVQAQTTAGLPELMQALFPAASITGAPKVSTMQIITALETTPRKIYTGAIGFYAPGRRAQFNVAIRTLLLDKQRQRAEYGVGGGIVWDSEAQDEWEETRTKARILHERPEPFDLLETMRWTPAEGWFLLEQHLDRLAASADYFSFPFERARLLAELDRLAQDAQGQPQRLRLRLTRDGQFILEAQPLPRQANPSRIVLASSPVHSGERFLYHKTTRRERYQQALAERPGYADVLLWNERGEVTESTIANLIVTLDGRQLTPALDCGLLPGTYRAWLLESGQVAEAVIRLEDLKRCSAVYLANSVRGMWPVQVDELP